MRRPASKVTRSHTRGKFSTMRRAEILGAAIRIFGRKGFEATRAEDIAAAAGLAKGTLYLYFRSKESIYAAALTQALRELEAEIGLRSEGADTFSERLAAAIHVRLEFWPEHKEIYRLLLTVGREARHRRQTNEILRAAQKSFLEIFNLGVARGEVESRDFGPLAWATLDMLRGANERRMDRVSVTTPREDAEVITEFVLRQVRLAAQAH